MNHFAHPRINTQAHRRAGFTLIEMVVVVAIVGVLAAAAQPLLALQTQRKKELELRHSLRLLRTAIDAYKQAVVEGRIAPTSKGSDESGYPPNLQVLVDGVELVPRPKAAQASTTDSEPRRIHFLRRMPRDPFYNTAAGEGAAHQSWGLRSHDSSAEAPQAGRDVFDVFSRSEGVGLDGTAYRSW